MTRPIDEIVVSVSVDTDDDHAEIALTPAPTLWASALDDFEPEVDEREATETQHRLVGLLARLALLVQDDLDLERLLHGCQRGPWMAHRDGAAPRRLRTGDRLRAGETARRDTYVDACGVCVVSDGPLDFALYVSVQKRHLARWKRRLAEHLEQLVAEVPE